MTRQLAFSAACGFLAPLLIGGCTKTMQLVQCSTTANCTAAQFCSGGTCYPKLAVGGCGEASDHSANEVCTSGICMGGACCTSACTAADPTCKAPACDVTSGACNYPSSTVTCGPPESCTSGSHTVPSSCDGRGGCALAQPTQCPSMACFDAHRCVATCTDNSGCAASEYCAYGQCAPKVAAGAICGPTSTSSASSECVSGACLGTRCCSSLCDTTDAQCGATDCDSSGACVYPTQTKSCGALQTCVASTYTPQSACNAQGACAVGAPRSCEPYVCNQPGAICQASCSVGGAECASDAYCDAQHCVSKGTPGTPCAPSSTSAANQACLSSICNVNCCVLDCPADQATNNCKGTCDSQGACTPKTCPNNFGCSGTVACNTQCAIDAECDMTAFCDPGGTAACCSKYTKGDTIYIDGVFGSDANPCCGAITHPCQTVSRAMALVAASAISGVILNAANGDGTSSWTVNESYPIHLGWGVTLTAPSISFMNQQYASDVFHVYAYAPTDTGTVTIQGGNKDVASDGVRIGFDLLTSAIRNTNVAVNDDMPGRTALPLVLSEVWLASYSFSADTDYSLKVGAGATVTLGPNPVEVGAGDSIGMAATGVIAGYHGIHCGGAGSFIRDDPKASKPVLTMDGLTEDDLVIEDGCTATLTQGPSLGYAIVSPAGWNGDYGACPLGAVCDIGCTSNASGGAVVAVGSGTVTFGSAQMPSVIRCARFGFLEDTSTAIGSPSVTVTNTTIDLLYHMRCDPTDTPVCGGSNSYSYACAGAMVTEGDFTAVSTTFTHAYIGAFFGSNAANIDLSGGGQGGNTITCNNKVDWNRNHFGAYHSCVNESDLVPMSSGAGIINASSNIGIDAQNATWDSYDSTAQTAQIWTCSDITYTDCTCSGPNCSSYTSPGPLPDGVDAVYLSANTAATPLDTAAGSQNSRTSCH